MASINKIRIEWRKSELSPSRIGSLLANYKVTSHTTYPEQEKPPIQLLRTDNLSVVWKGRRIVNSVSLRVNAGEIVGLLGPTEAGKTTLFQLIAGVRPVSEGTIFFEGLDISRASSKARKRLGLSVCIQHKRLLRPTSVFGQLCDAIERETKIICLDETFTGISRSSLQANATRALMDTARANGCGVLISDHDVRQTLDVVDRAYIIFEGKILREGTKESLFDKPIG